MELEIFQLDYQMKIKDDNEIQNFQRRSSGSFHDCLSPKSKKNKTNDQSFATCYNLIDSSPKPQGWEKKIKLDVKNLETCLKKQKNLNTTRNFKLPTARLNQQKQAEQIKKIKTKPKVIKSEKQDFVKPLKDQKEKSFLNLSSIRCKSQMELKIEKKLQQAQSLRILEIQKEKDRVNDRLGSLSQNRKITHGFIANQKNQQGQSQISKEQKDWDSRFTMSSVNKLFFQIEERKLPNIKPQIQKSIIELQQRSFYRNRFDTSQSILEPVRSKSNNKKLMITPNHNQRSQILATPQKFQNTATPLGSMTNSTNYQTQIISLKDSSQMNNNNVFERLYSKQTERQKIKQIDFVNMLRK